MGQLSAPSASQSAQSVFQSTFQITRQEYVQGLSLGGAGREARFGPAWAVATISATDLTSPFLLSLKIGVKRAAMNKKKIDEAVLALLYLNHWLERPTGLASAWKSFDWETMERLHEQGLISNPVSKSKVVAFSYEGLRKAKEAFVKLFDD